MEVWTTPDRQHESILNSWQLKAHLRAKPRRKWSKSRKIADTIKLTNENVQGLKIQDSCTHEDELHKDWNWIPEELQGINPIIGSATNNVDAIQISLKAIKSLLSWSKWLREIICHIRGLFESKARNRLGQKWPAHFVPKMATSVTDPSVWDISNMYSKYSKHKFVNLLHLQRLQSKTFKKIQPWEVHLFITITDN